VSLSSGAAGTFSETVTLTAAGSNASGYSGALPVETLTIVGTILPAAPTVYLITGAPQTIVGAAGADLFEAQAGSLNSRDSLTGGSGTNALILSGGGVFDLNAPLVLSGIPTVYATEGQMPSGYIAGPTPPIVLLRDGTAETLNVISGSAAFGNNNPESISIYGGNAADTINLGEGSDLVVLGNANESVYGGGGTALVQATAAQAGALVKGTPTGSTMLEITNGGTAALNANTTYATIQLDHATNLTLSKMGFISAVGEVSGNTIMAGAANQTLGGLGGGDALVGFSGFGDTFLGTSAGLAGDTITGFGGSDVIDITDMTSASVQPYVFNAGSLTVTDGTHRVTLSFGSGYTVSSFAAPVSDGHTGTLIKFV
jgi:hypothetical protein